MTVVDSKVYRSTVRERDRNREKKRGMKNKDD
jgi:hypothetical protein